MSENTDLTYYQRNKEILKKQARDKNKNNRNKKKEYGKNRYHNMSEEKKQKVKEYQNKYQKNY